MTKRPPSFIKSVTASWRDFSGIFPTSRAPSGLLSSVKATDAVSPVHTQTLPRSSAARRWPSMSSFFPAYGCCQSTDVQQQHKQ